MNTTVFVALLPLFLVPKPVRGQNLISVPFGVYGGICAETAEAEHVVLKVAKDLAVSRKVDSLEFRQVNQMGEGLPTQDLYVTFVREIFDGEEKNMSAIPRKTTSDDPARYWPWVAIPSGRNGVITRLLYRVFLEPAKPRDTRVSLSVF